MTSKMQVAKRAQKSSPPKSYVLNEVAIAAFFSSKTTKEVTDLINFFLGVLKKHSDWLNNVLNKFPNFKCALMVGAGPNRFQIQEMIYPSLDKQLKIEIELRGTEDHDKLAIAALIKLTDSELNKIKNKISERSVLKDDLLVGKGLGVHFAILKPLSENHFRINERLIIDSVVPTVHKKKRKSSETSAFTSMKRSRRVS